MILNHKLAKAEAMSCQIQSQIVIPCQLPVDGYDWNVLFGNLLDNAIEAMEQIKDRFGDSDTIRQGNSGYTGEKYV